MPSLRAMQWPVKGGKAVGSRNDSRESSEKVVATIQAGTDEM